MFFVETPVFTELVLAAKLPGFRCPLADVLVP
jgi:hypothetical protein